jgi:hypothetical protein
MRQGSISSPISTDHTTAANSDTESSIQQHQHFPHVVIKKKQAFGNTSPRLLPEKIEQAYYEPNTIPASSHWSQRRYEGGHHMTEHHQHKLRVYPHENPSKELAQKHKLSRQLAVIGMIDSSGGDCFRQQR